MAGVDAGHRLQGKPEPAKPCLVTAVWTPSTTREWATSQCWRPRQRSPNVSRSRHMPGRR